MSYQLQPVGLAFELLAVLDEALLAPVTPVAVSVTPDSAGSDGNDGNESARDCDCPIPAILKSIPELE
jgi:hypothetical protein